MSMYRMAGRAAAAGGADLSALPLTAIDLGDGSWTTTDPDSIVSSAVTSSGLTTFTYATIGSGSTDYAISAGANARFYRKHKVLLDSSGAAIVGGDSFLLIVEIDNTAGFSTDAATELFVGLGVDPAHTTATTAGLYGLTEQHYAAATPRYGSFVTNAANLLTNANNTASRCSIMVHANQVGHVENTATGGGAGRGTQARNPNRTYATDDQIYLVVGAGTLGAGTTTAGNTATAALRYRVIKLSS
jgi:hypothetical protein